MDWHSSAALRSRCNAPNILKEVPESYNPSRHRRIPSQQIPPARACLAHRQRGEVVHETAAEDGVAHTRCCREADAGRDLHEARGWDAAVVGGRGVVQEVEDADTREGLGDDVSEPVGGGGAVQRLEGGGDVAQLGEGVDDDEDVRGLEVVGVPEEHPCWS